MNHFLDHIPDLDLPARTLYRLRRGQGRLAVLVPALCEAGYALRPDPAALARRAGQREASRRAGIARATVSALANGRGTVQSYAALVGAMGITPRIAKLKSYAACLSSKNETWQTPQWLLGAILQAAGRTEFDLDPCSPRSDGPVPAVHRWTKAEDGLALPWSGLVFVNPPYSTALPKWVAKCLSEAANGAVVVALVPSRTDTRWWHQSIVGQADIVILRGRLKFGDSQNSAPFPSALAVWGDRALAKRIATGIADSWLISTKVVA